MVDLRSLIRAHPGKNRCDLSLLYRDHVAFAQVARQLAEPFSSKGVTSVAALDSLGFVLGTAVARELNCGLVLLRKAESAAWPADIIEFIDYSGAGKAFALVHDVVHPGDRILVVDDWSETGAQLEAAFSLLEAAGATVLGASVLRAEPAALQRLTNRVVHSVLTLLP